MGFFIGFPLGQENLEKWELIFQSGKSQGILNRLEMSRKIGQNTGKVREFLTNVIYNFLLIFKWTVYDLLKWLNFVIKNKRLKKYWKNGKKIREVRKSGNHVYEKGSMRYWLLLIHLNLQRRNLHSPPVKFCKIYLNTLYRGKVIAK